MISGKFFIAEFYNKSDSVTEIFRYKPIRTDEEKLIPKYPIYVAFKNHGIEFHYIGPYTDNNLSVASVETEGDNSGNILYGQLSLLKISLDFREAAKEIEKAFYRKLALFFPKEQYVLLDGRLNFDNTSFSRLKIFFNDVDGIKSTHTSFPDAKSEMFNALFYRKLLLDFIEDFFNSTVFQFYPGYHTLKDKLLAIPLVKGILLKSDYYLKKHQVTVSRLTIKEVNNNVRKTENAGLKNKGKKFVRPMFDNVLERSCFNATERWVNFISDQDNQSAFRTESKEELPCKWLEYIDVELRGVLTSNITITQKAKAKKSIYNKGINTLVNHYEIYKGVSTGITYIVKWLYLDFFKRITRKPFDKGNRVFFLVHVFIFALIIGLASFWFSNASLRNFLNHKFSFRNIAFFLSITLAVPVVYWLLKFIPIRTNPISTIKRTNRYLLLSIFIIGPAIILYFFLGAKWSTWLLVIPGISLLTELGYWTNQQRQARWFLSSVILCLPFLCWSYWMILGKGLHVLNTNNWEWYVTYCLVFLVIGLALILASFFLGAVVNFLLPRLILALITAWIGVLLSSDLWKFLFDISMQKVLIFSVLLLFFTAGFLWFEIRRNTGIIDRTKILWKVINILIPGYTLSLLIGTAGINATDRIALTRSDFFESQSIRNNIVELRQADSLQTVVDSLQNQMAIITFPMRNYDTNAKIDLDRRQKLHDSIAYYQNKISVSRNPDSIYKKIDSLRLVTRGKKNLQTYIAYKHAIVGKNYVTIYPGYLILGAAFALFSAIILTLLFDEKHITKPL